MDYSAINDSIAKINTSTSALGQQNNTNLTQLAPLPTGGPQPTNTTPTTTPPPPVTSSTTSTAPTSTPSADQTTLTNAQQQKTTADTEYQDAAQQVHDTILNIQNGSIPLNAGEQAQVAGLTQQFQALINQQKLTNKGAEGIANIRGYQSGAAEYDPTFQAKTIGAIVTGGLNKIAELNTKMASGVAALTQSLKDNDIAKVREAYSVYQEASKERRDALQSTIDDAQKSIKEAQDRQQKITDSVNQIAAEAAKNGASPATIKAITSSGSVSAALTAAGGSLQTATGQLGDYLQYKRDSEAKGQIPADYSTWKAVDDKRQANLKATEAYNTAYGAARGKLAGEGTPSGGVVDPKTGKTVILKPLTEVQAKDFTYAQRGEQGESIIDKLSNLIAGMPASNYAIQKSAENNDFTSQFVSPEFRSISQAERNFATAVLRRESGAAISASEFSTVEKQYFPRPGDDEVTLAQKKQNRETAINSFKSNVPNYDARASQTTSSLLNTAEDLAKGNVVSYGSKNPMAQTQITAMIKDGVPFTKIQEALGI
jgi:hypothetical protein